MERKEFTGSMAWPRILPDDVFSPLDELEKQFGIEIIFSSAAFKAHTDNVFYIPVGHALFSAAGNRPSTVTVPLEQLLSPEVPKGSWKTIISNPSGLENQSNYFNIGPSLLPVAECVGKSISIMWNFFETGALFFMPVFKDNEVLVNAYITNMRALVCWIADMIKHIYSEAGMFHISSELTRHISAQAKSDYSRRISEAQQIEIRIDEIRAEMTSAIARIDNERKTLTSIDTFIAGLQSNMAKQLSYIANHPRLSAVYVVGTSLVFVTKEVTFYDEEEEKHYLIGRMRFEINLNMSDTRVRIQNIDRQPGGRHHPHTNEGDRVCLGGYEQTITQNIISGNFDIVVQELINWSHSIDPHDSWGRAITSFPLVPNDHPLARK